MFTPAELESLGIDAGARAETLNLEQYLRLAALRTQLQ
jgi:hypothetical protein